MAKTVRSRLGRLYATSKSMLRLSESKSNVPVQIQFHDHYYKQVLTCQIPNLWFLYEKFLGKRNKGIFVEIGGFDGVFASNSWGLAQAGWKGYLVEPNPESVSRCREAYKSDTNVEIIELAIGPLNQDMLDLYLSGTLTTANRDQLREYETVDWAKETVENWRTVRVPCVTLNSLLSSRNLQPGFDVLIVDVEGYESQVFSGFDLTFWHPKMCVIELANTHPDLTVTSSDDSHLQKQITESGYIVAYKDAINTVFVHQNYWK